MASEQTWTSASIDTALVHVNTVLSRLRQISDSLADGQSEPAIEEARKAKRAFEKAPETKRAIKEARALKLHLEQNPSACTAAGLTCCRRLLEVIEA